MPSRSADRSLRERLRKSQRQYKRSRERMTSRWRKLINAWRQAVGLRRITRSGTVEAAVVSTREPEVELQEEREAIERGISYTAALVGFGVIVTLALVAYGYFAKIPPPHSMLDAHKVLAQATTLLGNGDIQGAENLRKTADKRLRNDPAMYLLDGYLLAARGQAPEDVEKRLGAKSRFRRTTVRNLVTLAGFRERSGDRIGAAEAISRAAEASPENVSVWMLQMGVYLGAGQFDRAIALANRTEDRIGPNLPSSLIRGWANLRAGRPKEARHEFQTAMIYAEEAVQPRIGLFDALIAMGETESALQEAQAAVRLDPEDAEAYSRLGAGLLAIGEDEKAEVALRRAMELNSGDYIVLNNLAYLLSQKDGGLTEALKLARQAYQLSPTNPAVLDSLGAIYCKMGRYNEALPLLELAYQQMPGREEIKRHLATARAGLSSAEDTGRRPNGDE